ncbi:MAG TPA: hypothetical protein VGM30_17565 [Puia sp.]|jgi:hypothetical protein
MPIITFSGKISDAESTAVHLSVAGPDHFFFSNSYEDDFGEKLNLPPGDYLVFVSAFSDGDFVFNVTGNIRSITPAVPDDYASKSKQSYQLTV